MNVNKFFTIETTMCVEGSTITAYESNNSEKIYEPSTDVESITIKRLSKKEFDSPFIKYGIKIIIGIIAEDFTEAWDKEIEIFKQNRESFESIMKSLNKIEEMWNES